MSRKSERIAGYVRGCVASTALTRNTRRPLLLEPCFRALRRSQHGAFSVGEQVRREMLYGKQGARADTPSFGFGANQMSPLSPLSPASRSTTAPKGACLAKRRLATADVHGTLHEGGPHAG